MARRRSQRTRAQLLAELDRMRSQLEDVRRVASRAAVYVNEIYFPNIREPRSIDNRRLELVDEVEAWRARLGLPPLRRAA